MSWLRDFLPSHFPTARILTYGYAGYSHANGKRKIAKQTLYGYGENLVTTLWLDRGEEVRKLLVFCYLTLLFRVRSGQSYLSRTVWED